MLQHNIHIHASARAGRRAHLAHAAVLGMHTICCGLPAAAALVAAASGATTGVTLLGGAIGWAHAWLHGGEIWILALSGALVGAGAWFELRARRAGARHFPWLLAISAACLVANCAIILAHRGGV